MENIYCDIARRTGGNIYIGVVGPVRTGKSTLIKRIMETLVIPNIQDPYRKERAQDELPQSGSGKTIMTSEPKFVPEEAVEISPDGISQLRVRMIDSVGYMVNGAIGADEDGQPRMVATPWYDHEIPMTEAAELGTKKVMEEHCSIGLVVTTDGTVTDIPRQDYLDAECRAIKDMQATGKPFLVIVNSCDPGGNAAAQAKQLILESYGITPLVMDCQLLDEEGVVRILKQLLLTFPLKELRVYMPRWVGMLEDSDPVKCVVYEALLTLSQQITELAQAEDALEKLKDLEQVKDFTIQSIDLSTGTVCCQLQFPESLFYQILSNKTGMQIDNDSQLMAILSDLSRIKKEYDRIADAIAAVNTTGYGVVMPSADEMTMEPPQVIRKGGAFGVQLKASAPSIHMIRVDINTQINPMVGGEQQSQDLINYLSGEDAEKLWKTNIFGKSVYDLIQEGLTAKLLRTPDDVREKFRGSLTRIVNDGANGLICLIL